MSVPQNKEIIKRIFEDGFTKGNLEIFDETLTEDVKLHDPATPDFPGGLSAFKDWEGSYQKAFPGKKALYDELIVTEDRAALHWTVHGVQKGDMPEIPATNREINITGIMLLRFSQGKVAEIWNVWDRLGFYKQLGIKEIP